MIKPLVAGNWKMNGLKAASSELTQLIQNCPDTESPESPDIMICPPATLVAGFAELAASSPVIIGAQDCHVHEKGAHTGDISAEMFADAGARAIIVGHSERRADHGESNELVKTKALAAHRSGLAAIVCIGETEDQRNAGKTLAVVEEQLTGSLPDEISGETVIVAYEPVWAIGTGRTPTVEDVAEVHGVLREQLIKRFGAETGNAIRLLYGGSVKPENARELMSIANVDGALVGGASLKAGDLLGIVSAYSPG